MKRAAPAAAHAARKVGLRRGLPQADQDDLRQEILLAVLLRGHHYDARRGAQSTFLKIVTQTAVADHRRAARSSALFAAAGSQPEDIAPPGDPEGEVLLRIALAAALAALPPTLLQVVSLIAECGSAAEAQRASAQPLCTFYRRLREVRMRLRLAGLAPTP